MKISPPEDNGQPYEIEPSVLSAHELFLAHVIDDIDFALHRVTVGELVFQFRAGQRDVVNADDFIG